MAGGANTMALMLEHRWNVILFHMWYVHVCMQHLRTYKASLVYAQGLQNKFSGTLMPSTLGDTS